VRTVMSLPATSTILAAPTESTWVSKRSEGMAQEPSR
jgi:hypothetical protein